MKSICKLTLVFIIGAFFYSNAQVRVGGGVSVDIDIPFPDVVIGNKKRRNPAPVPQPIPRRVPNPQPVPRRVPAPRPTGPTRDYYYDHSLGTINNQNRPDGNFLLHVTNAYLNTGNRNNEHVVYELNNGETLEFIIQTHNPNDFNYHFYNHHHNQHNNIIVAILLNGREIPIRDSALSLQPQHHGFHSVINLHTVYDGDFNGTVNF